MLVQILECILAGIKLGFQAIFSALPIYNQLSSIPQDIICMALGVPSILITIVCVLFGIFKFVKKHS